ncbi:MAG TPA: diacylglycerol kinase family protein [Gemmatimonadaceae bacterium]|nr:diacylglycerol kinase family protein [Gemmatimonadaceae bacterium]
MSDRACVILNPAAGRGRGARVLPAVRRHFAAVGITDVRTTVAKGEERALARRAIDEGCSTLVAVGGDGTWSNVASAIIESGADCRLALLAAGTGNDFVKSVGAPAHDLAATARLTVEGPDLRVDVGRVERTYFLNVCGFGFDTAVLEDVQRSAWLRGRAVYLCSAIRQLAAYRGLDIGVGSSHGRRARVRHLMLAVSNGRQFGGAFRIAPVASLTDQRLDVIAIHDAPTLRRFHLLVAATRGTHTAEPEVVAEQAQCVALDFAVPPAYEADGEYHRATGAELEIVCVPRALRVVTGRGEAVPT